LSALQGIIEHPLAELSDECRKMLKAIVPWSICVPIESRDQSQISCIKMLTEVHEQVQRSMQEAIDAEEFKVADIENNGASFTERLRYAEDECTEAKQIVDDRTKDLAEISESLFSARKGVTEAKSEQAVGDADLNKIRNQQSEFENALENSLRPLKGSEWKDEDGPGLLKVLLAAANKLSLEDSLKSALSNSGLKRDRGPFDVMVFDQLEESLQTKIEALSQEAAPLLSSASERATKVQIKEAELEQFTNKQRDAANELSRVQAEHKKTADNVATIKHDSATFEPTLAKAKAVLKKKQDELQSFKDFNIAIFDMFLERSNQPKEVDETVAPEGGA